MDVEELYDEFGNYIGPELSDSESDASLHDDNPKPEQTTPQENGEDHVDASANGQTSSNVLFNLDAASRKPQEIEVDSQAIVLAEDKQYYPSAEEVFGPDTEVLIEEEDAQGISEPLIAPIVEPSSGLHESQDTIPPAKHSRKFLTDAVLPYPPLIRNVALVGHLHHGKTSFVDMLFEATHDMPWKSLDDRDVPVRYMDTRRDEQQLKVSIKSTAATFLMQNSTDKSYGITVLDTPGHINFLDEAIAAMNLVDGVVVLVDVAEGVMMGTDVLLRRAALMRLDIILLISKIDRLCLELRVPPMDAYHKIRDIIDTVNDILEPYDVPPLSPSRGNVAFSSATEGVCFTLKQFAQVYIDEAGGVAEFPLSASQLSIRLWGDVYFDQQSRKFSKKPGPGADVRTFVSFVLEPLYKLHTAVLSHDVEDLTEYLQRNKLLASKRVAVPLGRNSVLFGGGIRRSALDGDLKAQLKHVGKNVFGMGSMTGFVDMLVRHVKSPEDAAQRKLRTMYGYESMDSDESRESWFSSTCTCSTDAKSPLSAFVGKLIPDEKGLHFDCLVRILNSSIRKGGSVRILGNSFDKDSNEEDQSLGKVADIFVPCGRFKISLDVAKAGQIVLIRGIDSTVFKSATLVSATHPASSDAFIFRPLQEHIPTAVVKVSVEPVRPSELPKMISSLRQCVNSYPGLVTKVEETGEHTLLGSGELYMDCVLRDLREAFASIEVKVSDPVVPFAETVLETSALKCYAETQNKKNKITMIAEPLEESIMKALDNGILAKNHNSPEALRECGWDALASKSLWTFGPDKSKGPNALLNDVLIEDYRLKADLIRNSIVQGFCWAVREGPLADEPVRGVKVRLLNTTISDTQTGRSAAQVIPTCRRVVYSSILTATPRLMEPVYVSEVICAPESANVLHAIAGKRRGTVIAEADVPGTPLKRMILHMPVLESFGFETELRSLTYGSAFCLQLFDHWSVVPGDPLDKSIPLPTLHVAGRAELARECMVKTRRRKGMPDDVSITKYFDDPLLVELAADNEVLRQFL
ncbi:Elongation factor Tu GTP-binding domain containing protein [Gracilaria domingensis]|nr:Elongation factor Tu GTP-binding domain containing protein [Gracilaria domingensis]